MKISAAVIAFLLSSTTAFAADLAPKPVEPVAPVEASSFTWTGIYGGIQAGYTFGKSDLQDYLIVPHAPDYAGDASPAGFTGGGYVGAQYQFGGNIVVGIEGDINYDDVKDTGAAHGLIPGTQPYAAMDTKLKWDGSARLRAGYAIDRFLPYVTGGVAFGQYEWDPHWPIDGILHHAGTQTGWTIGAGLDYAITDNIIARIEYRYTDYGKKAYVDNVSPAYADEINLKTNTIRAGIAYKF